MPSRSFSLSSFLSGAAASAAAYAAFTLIQRRLEIRKKNQDEEAVARAESYCWKLVEHSFTGALIYVMDELGMFVALSDTGPTTVHELALHTGYSERWLRELLSQSTGAGICAFKDSKFSLRPEYGKLLLPPDKEMKSVTGMFRFLRGLISDRPEATIRACRSGIGVDYDFGDSVIDGIDQKNRNFFIYNLIPDIIQKVTVPLSGNSLYDELKQGAKVADIGCGCGTSTIVMAKEFPKSQFYAFEASRKSLEILEKRIQENALENVTACNVASRSIADGPNPGNKSGFDDNQFDFVYSHDLLHDMTDPRSLISEVKGQLSKDGCWVIVDVKCDENMAKNLAMPNSALNFGFSCLLCLSSATSCRNAQGLGTMGFHSKLAKKWMIEMGFDHFSELEIKSKPDNSCFIVA